MMKPILTQMDYITFLSGFLYIYLAFELYTNQKVKDLFKVDHILWNAWISIFFLMSMSKWINLISFFFASTKICSLLELLLIIISFGIFNYFYLRLIKQIHKNAILLSFTFLIYFSILASLFQIISTNQVLVNLLDIISLLSIISLIYIVLFLIFKNFNRVKQNYFFIGLLVVTLICGWLVTNWYGRSMETADKNNLINIANIFSSGIDVNHVKSLDGTKDDLKKEDYQVLKNMLVKMHESSQYIRYFHILGLKNNEIICLVNSEPENSQDYASPGELYDESFLEIRNIFLSGKTIFIPPSKDSWGNCVSSFAPIYSESNQVIAIFGVEMDAHHYINHIDQSRFFAMMIFLTLSSFLVLFIYAMQKSSESNLIIRKSREKLKLIIENSPIGNASFGENGYLYSSNHAFKVIFGLPFDTEPVHFSIFHDHALTEEQRNLLIAGKTINFVCRYTTSELEKIMDNKLSRTGEIDLEVIIISFIINNETHQVEYLLHVQDISQRRKIEKMKDDFIGCISHEIRTPLTSIKEGMTIFLKYYGTNLNQDQIDLIMTALRNVDRLSKLADNILNFHQLESMEISLNLKPESINHLIEDIYNKIPQDTKKDLVMELDLATELPDVCMDRKWISRVLENLIENALQFTEKGTIVIRTEMDLNKIKVSVSDTGIGMDELELKELFKPFYQSDSGLKRATGGVGLGLPICKKVLQAHKSDIFVDSIKGKGTTFFFLLDV